MGVARVVDMVGPWRALFVISEEDAAAMAVDRLREMLAS